MEDEKKSVTDEMAKLDKLFDSVLDSVCDDIYFYAPPRFLWKIFCELMDE